MKALRSTEKQKKKKKCGTIKTNMEIGYVGENHMQKRGLSRKKYYKKSTRQKGSCKRKSLPENLKISREKKIEENCKPWDGQSSQKQ